MCWCRPHQRTPKCDRVECVPGTRPATAAELAAAAAQSCEVPPNRPARHGLQLMLEDSLVETALRYAQLLDQDLPTFVTRAIEARVRECRQIEHTAVRKQLLEELR